MAAPQRDDPGEQPNPCAQLVALGVKAARAYHRPDLEARLNATDVRLRRGAATVLVAGEFKAGKSSLVNALVGVDICPVDDDVATGVLTVLYNATEPVAHIVRGHGDDVVVEQITGPTLDAWITETDTPDRAASRVEIGLPSPLLAEGIMLVDTPGVGGLGGPAAALTTAAASIADAVVFVTPASREFTTTEVEALRRFRDLCPTVMVVESKTDLLARWRDVVARDREHLERNEIAATVVGVSALLRRLACAHGDVALDDESGAPVLVDWLVDVVAGGREQAAQVGAARAVVDVARQLEAQFAPEREALADPERAAALIGALAAANQTADDARAASAKWSQALNDSFADATTTLDRDLRERIRALVAEAETSVDHIDPARHWPDFERMLYDRASAAAAEHACLRHERLLEAVASVEAFFGDCEVAGLVEIAPALDARSRAGLRLDVSRTGVATQTLTLLRSSYGGLAMLGFFGGFAGVAIAAPALVGVGLLLGGKSFKDERARLLAQRRSAAKVASRKYLDDISYALGSETRDVVRVTQRRLRDDCAARAQEQQRTAQEALAAARRAAERGESDRRERLAHVDAELERIHALLNRGGALLEALA